MARGKNSRRRASLDAPAPATARKHPYGTAPAPPVHLPRAARRAATAPEDIHDAIDFHWKNLSLDLKRFLLESPHELSLRKFVTYWTFPARYENTNPNIAASICGCSWYLALNYMTIGKIVEARALILNGCFLQQCYNKPIDEIAAITESVRGDSFREQLPFFADGLLAITSEERIAAFLRSKVSSDYQRRMSFATQTPQTREKVRDYVDQISGDWHGGRPGARRERAARRRRATLAAPPDAERIEVRLVDDRTGEATAVRYDAATTTKALFKQYAEDRGASLRQLRFSHRGTTLFLSSVGHRSARDLGIRHLDEIVVTNSATAAAPPTPREDGGASDGPPVDGADEARERPSRKVTGPSRSCRRASWAGPEIVGEEERRKLEHSSRLSRVFAEAAPQFARRRQKLHALTLACTPPKAKGARRRPPVALAPLPTTARPGDDAGGKAGVPFYAVRVGAAENLHRTRIAPSKARALDLHGLTAAEALARLDAALPGWIEVAMRGAYPWVIPAVIVCGGGHQVLSEVVEGWIKGRDGVARAPQKKLSRRSSI